MRRDLYRYTFPPGPPTEEIEGTLMLAVIAAEGLHGEARVRLDCAHYFDAEKRQCVIDAGTSVGQDINRLFIQFLRRELGDDGFTVRRLARAEAPAGAREKETA